MWFVAYIVMILTLGWISMVNTGGETNTDVHGKFGPPIMLMIMGALFVFLIFILLLINDFCYSGSYKCLYFFVPVTFLVFLFMGMILPCYTLEMMGTE